MGDEDVEDSEVVVDPGEETLAEVVAVVTLEEVVVEILEEVIRAETLVEEVLNAIFTTTVN